MKKRQQEIVSQFLKLKEIEPGATKKELIDRISLSEDIKPGTIKTWIRRYSDEVKTLDVKVSTKELNKRQELYIKGISRGLTGAEAKRMAGYSEKTMVKTIEQTEAVYSNITEARDSLFNHMSVGFLATLKTYEEIRDRARNEIEVLEKTTEITNTGDEKTIIKEKIKRNYEIELNATKMISKLLGYDQPREHENRKSKEPGVIYIDDDE